MAVTFTGKGPNSLEQQYFKTQRDQIKRNYLFGVGQNKFDQTKANWGFKTQREDVTRNYGINRRSLAGGFNSRGRFGGGAWGRALSDLQQDKRRANERINMGQEYSNEGFNLAKTQLFGARQGALWDSGAQEAALRLHLKAQEILDGR